MGTERALGKGGHSAAAEKEALGASGKKRPAAEPRAAASKGGGHGGTHGGGA